MTEEIAQEDVIEEVVAEEAAEEVTQSEPSEVEQEAAKMGWTPKDQFKGDPDKWRSAEDFVERGKTMLPIVKAQVTRQAKEIEELKAAIKQFGEYHTKTEQRAYEKALNELREQRAQAIASGDGAEFDRVDTELNAMRENFKPPKVEVEQRDSESDPVYVEWKSRNQWVSDPRAEKWAFSYGNYLINAGKAEPGIDVFEKITKAAKAEFPEKFTNPRRESAPSVEGGMPSPRKGGKTFADLPADARQACERMARNAYSGDEKQAAKFKAEYVKNYFEGA